MTFLTQKLTQTTIFTATTYLYLRIHLFHLRLTKHFVYEINSPIFAYVSFLPHECFKILNCFLPSSYVLTCREYLLVSRKRDSKISDEETQQDILLTRDVSIMFQVTYIKEILFSSSIKHCLKFFYCSYCTDTSSRFQDDLLYLTERLLKYIPWELNRYMIDA